MQRHWSVFPSLCSWLFEPGTKRRKVQRSDALTRQETHAQALTGRSPVSLSRKSGSVCMRMAPRHSRGRRLQIGTERAATPPRRTWAASRAQSVEERVCAAGTGQCTRLGLVLPVGRSEFALPSLPRWRRAAAAMQGAVQAHRWTRHSPVLYLHVGAKASAAEREATRAMSTQETRGRPGRFSARA